jgi:hypothetical protein
MAHWEDIAGWWIALGGAIVWLGVLVVVLGICRSAARGDRALFDAPAGTPPGPESARLRLVA